MKKTTLYSDIFNVQERLLNQFEYLNFNDSEIPFLFYKNSFENNFYYLSRFKISVTDVIYTPVKSETKKLKIGVIANSFHDMTLGERIQRDFRLLKSKQAEVVIIPVGYDWFLSGEDSELYRKFVSDYFDLLISLGGDDLHPHLYNQANIFSKNINFDRDLSEIKLVEYFKKNSNGIFLGICRGHQLSAVVDGCELVQDLSEIHPECLNVHHKLVDEKPEYLFHKIVLKPSLISRLLGFKNSNDMTVLVNSFHHQAVKKTLTHMHDEIAFDETHQVIEGIESKDKRSISVQFHPELPEEMNKNPEFSELGHKFIHHVKCYARLQRIKTRKKVNSLNVEAISEELNCESTELSDNFYLNNNSSKIISR